MPSFKAVTTDVKDLDRLRSGGVQIEIRPNAEPLGLWLEWRDPRNDKPLSVFLETDADETSLLAQELMRVLSEHENRPISGILA